MTPVGADRVVEEVVGMVLLVDCVFVNERGGVVMLAVMLVPGLAVAGVDTALLVCTEVAIVGVGVTAVLLGSNWLSADWISLGSAETQDGNPDDAP